MGNLCVASAASKKEMRKSRNHDAVGTNLKPGALKEWTDLQLLHQAHHFREEIKAMGERGPSALERLARDLESGTFQYGEPNATACAEAVLDLMRRLHESLIESNPSLFQRSVLCKVGSYWDGSRVSAFPDEFDFIILMPASGFRLEKAPGVLNWRVYLADEQKHMRYDRGCESFAESLLDGRFLVHPRYFYNYFSSHVDQLFPDVILPAGLTHGGLFSPAYRGLVNNIPAVTKRLVWQAKHVLTVDLSLGFPVFPLAEMTTAVTLETTERFARLSGLVEPPLGAICLVPGEHTWLPSTTVLETAALTHMGQSSSFVASLRVLKLICRRFFQWGPTTEMITWAKSAVSALTALGTTSTGRTSHNVNVETGVHLAESVSASLATDSVLLPLAIQEDKDEMYLTKQALVLAAVHAAHTAKEGHTVVRGELDEGAADRCALCASLIKESRYLRRGMVHPSVTETLVGSAKPWTSIRSVYLKYLLIEMIMRPDGSQRQTDLHSNHQTQKRGDNDRQSADHWDDQLIVSCLIKLAEHLKNSQSNPGIQHPILGSSLDPIRPLSWRHTEGWQTSDHLKAQHAELAACLVDVLSDAY